MLAATAESSPPWSELSAVMLLIASFGSGSFASQEALVVTTGMSTSLDGARKGGWAEEEKNQPFGSSYMHRGQEPCLLLVTPCLLHTVVL